MKYWKSALFGSLLVAVGSSFGYVEAVQTADTPASIDINNNTAATLNVTGARFSGATNLTWGYPWTNGYKQTVDGVEYQAVFLPDEGGSGRLIGGGQSKGGAASWGSNGTLNNLTPLIDAGGCADPAKPQDEPSIVFKDLDAILADPNYYNPNHKYLDTLGSNGGEYSARWVDTFYGQTQIQWAVGGTRYSGSWSGALSDTSPGNADGPMYWMALAGVQELFSMDAQYLMAIGLKETGIGSDEPTAPRMTNGDGAYGAFELEMFTGVSRFLVYPKFYPRWASELAANATLVPNDATTFVTLTGSSFAGLMDPLFGTTSDPNKAHMVNSAVMSGLLIYQYYDMIGTASDYCGRRAFSSEAADPYLGLCAIAAHYNLGINGGTPTALTNPGTIADPNGCDAVPAGNSAYVPSVRGILEALVTDQRRWMAGDAGVHIIDKNITMADVQTFFWGDGGSKDAPGPNGMMYHFELDPATDDAFWADITNTFNKLSNKWGGSHISFRYDWLTLLRVAKAYLDTDRPAPTGDEANRYLTQHSGGTQCDNTVAQDEQWPFLTASGDLQGDFKAKAEVYDAETGALYLQYSVNNGPWNSVVGDSSYGGTTWYEFTVPASLIPKEGGDVWVRAADSCKNEVAYKLTIEGAKIPDLDSAWAYDVDGDGYADKIDFAGKEHVDASADRFASWTAIDYQWPDVSNSFAAATGDPKVVLTGTTGSIDEPSLTGGRSNGGELTMTWNGGKRSTLILDRVGPAILGASMHEPTSPGQDDTLFVTFTEVVNDLSVLAATNIINVNTVATNHSSLFFISGATWGFVYPTGTIDSTKKVNINYTSGLQDQNGGNAPLINNIEKPIILNKGPVPLAQDGHGFYDVNVDGTMDRVQLKFSIPITQPQVDLMQFEVKWLQSTGRDVIKTLTPAGSEWVINPSDPTVITWDIPESEGLKANYTYINSEIAGMGQVTVRQASLDDPNTLEASSPNVLDKMGPVIIDKGGAILVKTPRPDIKSDLLRVTFSEPVQQTTLDHYLSYKKGALEYHWANGVDGIRFLANGNAVIIPYTPELTDRPSIGDSIKIEVDSTYGQLIRDNEGNLAHVNNPRRIIDGKVIVIFFSPNIVEYNNEGVMEANDYNYAWGVHSTTIPNPNDPLNAAAALEGNAKAIIFPATTPNSEIYDKYGMGFGFSLSFANDSTKVNRFGTNFQVEANIYSNLGSHVIALNDKINCWDVATSVEMQGTAGENACQESGVGAFSPSTEFKVFYPWNFLTTEKRLVGSGAYFIQMKVDGSTIDDGELKKTFGVIRGKQRKSGKDQTIIDPMIP